MNILFSRPARGALACAGFWLAFAGSVSGQHTDFSRPLVEGGAVPEYSIPYALPDPVAIKQTLDRIRDHVVARSSFRVFDNATGREIERPDMDAIVPTAVIDGRFGAMNRWDYTNGVVLTAFSAVTDITGDESFFAYNNRFYDYVFTWMPYFRAMQEQTGRRNDYSRMVHMHALDHCGSITAALVRTHLKTPDPRYREWIDVVEDYISNRQFRLPDGTLARERPQPVAVWTDDMYMSVPFLVQMGRLTGERRYWEDAVRQVVQMSERLFEEERGLYVHGWSENTAPFNPRFHWGRANGWASLAMVEVLDALPSDFPGYDRVLHLFLTHLRSVAELQDGSGLWHNLLDKPQTYLETSASAMFTYAVAKGINEGWISHVYGPVAVIGWNAVAERVLPDGRVDGICEGTTYANDAAYYFNRGSSANTTFFGPVILAGAEMIRLLENPKLRITPPRPDAVNSAIHFNLSADPLPR
jgi:rhamnogalacturonyl hydrolase YesR